MRWRIVVAIVLASVLAALWFWIGRPYATVLRAIDASPPIPLHVARAIVAAEPRLGLHPARLSPQRSLWWSVRNASVGLLAGATRSKEQFAAWYAHDAYMGQTAERETMFGFDRASREYFGKPLGSVDIAEAATLAGLIRSPSHYSPSRNPERSAARTEAVLKVMLGNGAISREQYETALEASRQRSRRDRTDAPR